MDNDDGSPLWLLWERIAARELSLILSGLCSGGFPSAEALGMRLNDLITMLEPQEPKFSAVAQLPYWRNMNQTLKDAIEAFIGEGELSAEHMEVLKNYFLLWLNYPWCAIGPEQQIQIDIAIAQCETATSRRDIRAVLDNALKLGIDPL